MEGDISNKEALRVANEIRLCERFSWDYYQLLSQPFYWRESIMNFFVAEQEYQEAHQPKPKV